MNKRWLWGVALAVAIATLLSLDYLTDVWNGLWYKPGATEIAVRDDLELTADGGRIFNATQPTIEQSSEFNSHCQNHNEETSLLGCYVGGRIYVYAITNEQLRAANKVTAAHELLHAVWERMGESEKKQVQQWLEEVQRENQAWFETELAYYDEGDKLEEVYTRAGTKLENLPAELEKHYARYFRNRAKIVAYYREYEAPFLALQKELETLGQTIDCVAKEIEAERATYLDEAERMNRRVDSFNACAETAGCFQTESEFQQKRLAILRDQDVLEAARQRLNQKITENNARIEEHQRKLADLGELNDAMNSRVELVEGVEAI